MDTGFDPKDILVLPEERTVYVGKDQEGRQIIKKLFLLTLNGELEVPFKLSVKAIDDPQTVKLTDYPKGDVLQVAENLSHGGLMRQKFSQDYMTRIGYWRLKTVGIIEL